MEKPQSLQDPSYSKKSTRIPPWIGSKCILKPVSRLTDSLRLAQPPCLSVIGLLWSHGQGRSGQVSIKIPPKHNRMYLGKDIVYLY